MSTLEEITTKLDEIEAEHKALLSHPRPRWFKVENYAAQKRRGARQDALLGQLQILSWLIGRTETTT